MTGIIQLTPEEFNQWPSQTKCCGKCAFRSGSEERADVWTLVRIQESGQDGQPFFCHETVPLHYQYVDDGTQSFRLCAGFNAHRRTGFENMLKLED
tara:strand:- start:733 stop:1020 length:288 start_codon:yes stop_codon:yes gene_type:complete